MTDRDIGLLHGDAIPSARYFRVYRCSSSEHAHIVLFDEHDEPFAQFTVGESNVDHIVATCTAIFSSHGCH